MASTSRCQSMSTSTGTHLPSTSTVHLWRNLYRVHVQVPSTTSLTGACVTQHFFNNNNWMPPWKNRTSQCISFFAHQSMVFYFRCSVYWWKGSVRFLCF